MDSVLMLKQLAPARTMARDGERCWHVIGRILFLDSQGEDSCPCQSLEDQHTRHADSLYIREQLTDCLRMNWILKLEKIYFGVKKNYE